VSQYSEYSLGSPRTPLPRTPLLGGKFIEIQPRSDSSDLRDKRMLMPVTRKRKGNNRYGQSGSYRCLRCQKGKRKCVYDSKKNDCQRCLERGFTDCGEKLPTPRKLAALRLLQESADRYLSKQQSSQQSNPLAPHPRAPSLRPPHPKTPTFVRPPLTTKSDPSSVSRSRNYSIRESRSCSGPRRIQRLRHCTCCGNT